MSNDEGHVGGGGDPKDKGDCVKDITQLLLESPSSLEALGRGLLLSLSPLMSQTGNQVSNQVSGNHPPLPPNNLPSMHPTQHYNPLPPWYPPYPVYGPPSYGHPYPRPYPLMGGNPYGQQDRSGNGMSRQSKSSLPGNPGCAPHAPSSSQEVAEGLLASYPGPFEGRRRKGLVHTDCTCVINHPESG